MWSRIPHPHSVILKLFGLIRIEGAVCDCYGFFGQTCYHFSYWANPDGGLELGNNLSKGNHSWWSSCSWLACFFCRSLAVGSKSGYKFFSLSSVDKLEQIYECSEYLFFFFFLFFVAVEANVSFSATLAHAWVEMQSCMCPKGRDLSLKILKPIIVCQPLLRCSGICNWNNLIKFFNQVRDFLHTEERFWSILLQSILSEALSFLFTLDQLILFFSFFFSSINFL